MKTSPEMFRPFFMRAFLQLGSFDLSKISVVHHVALKLTWKNRAQFPRQLETQRPNHSVVIHRLVPLYLTHSRNLSLSTKNYSQTSREHRKDSEKLLLLHVPEKASHVSISR